MSSSVVMAAAFLSGLPVASGDASGDELRLLLDGFERISNDVGDVADQSYVELLADRLGDVVEVGFVAFRQKHGAESGSMRGEQFLLDTADGQDPPVERDLTGHADVGAHRSSGRE